MRSQEYYGMGKTNKDLPEYYNLMHTEDHEKYKALECKHILVEIEKPAGHYGGWHIDMCVKCNIKIGYDTSD